VELAEGEPGRGTVVLIPPNSGLQLLVDYRVLARHLEDGRRVITFTPQGLTGRDAPLDTVAALARHYRERLRAAVPSGPVVIGGHSLGGSVALEMARLIDGDRIDGDRIDGTGAVAPVVVEAVVMFDTRRYDDPWARRRVRLKRPVRRIRQALRAQVLPALREGGSPEVIIGEAGAAARRAALTYRPEPYAGRVIYLAAQGTPDHPEQLRRDEGWTDLLTDIEVLEVPGRHSGHESMLTEPHVVTTAARLRRGLAAPAEADPTRDQAKIGPTAG
jgi:thioesterase domain-containing protein